MNAVRRAPQLACDRRNREGTLAHGCDHLQLISVIVSACHWYLCLMAPDEASHLHLFTDCGRVTSVSKKFRSFRRLPSKAPAFLDPLSIELNKSILPIVLENNPVEIAEIPTHVSSQDGSGDPTVRTSAKVKPETID